jgi:hypothetical protein
MIFFAVAAPTPGRDSRSLCDAEFKSILDPLAGIVEALVESDDFEAFADLEDDGALVEAAPEAVTIGVILSMVFCETPAFDRSFALE